MARKLINVGSAINAGDGEAIRNAFASINEMTAEIYERLRTNGLDPDFLPANSLLNAKLGQMGPNTVKANLTGSAATPQDVGYAALTAALGISPSVATLSSAYTVAGTDIGKLFLATGSFPLSTAAAAVVGDSFNFMVLNAGTGIVTIDPNAAETINGLPALKVYPGESLQVISTGVNWLALFGNDTAVLAKSPPAGTAAPLPELLLDLPSEFARYELEMERVLPASAGTPELFVRFFIAGSLVTTGYLWAMRYFSSSPADYTSGAAGSPTQTAGIALSAGAMPSGATAMNAAKVQIFPGAADFVPSLIYQGGFGDYGTAGFGRSGTAGRAEKIRLGIAGGISFAAGLKYTLTGRRA